jgi:hypothetical protein
MPAATLSRMDRSSVSSSTVPATGAIFSGAASDMALDNFASAFEEDG